MRARATARAAALVVLLAAALVDAGCRGCERDPPQDPATSGGTEQAEKAPFPAIDDAHRPQRVGAELDWVDISAEYLNTCGIRGDGSLWCWGRNTTGQLGDGSTTPRPAPVRIGAATDWAQVRQGDHHTCGLRQDHSLWCWGDHANGVPGRGLTVRDATPTRLDLRAPGVGGAPLAFTDLSVGDAHLCGVATDGSAWCWGRPGVLGDGVNEFVDRPQRVRTESIQPAPRFVSIETGTFHTCGLTDDGRIYCWGQEDHGQIGDGGGLQDDRPVPIGLDRAGLEAAGLAGETVFADVSASTYHTCAVTRSGAALCWGANQHGQLGVGDRTDRASPSRVDVSALPPGTTFAAIDCGFDSTCAVDVSGRLWCWGRNPRSGDAVDPTPRRVPVPGAAAGVRVRRISAGVSHWCAITTDGAAWCWGTGTFGQLGGGGVGGGGGGRGGG